MRFAILICTAMAAAASPALACSCRCADAATLLRETPLLCTGRAVAERVEGNLRRYTVEVTAVHKGEAAGRIELGTAVHSAACGVKLTLGREDLLGAHPGAEGARINLCTQYCIGQRREELDRLIARCTPGGRCPPEG